MIELGLRYREGRVLLREVARRQAIPEKYLEQLIRPLRRAKLVRSIRGAHGGYLLARPPEEIRLSEILEALEGPLRQVDLAEESAASQSASVRAVVQVWEQLGTVMYEALQNVTLAQLCDRQRTLEAEGSLMYHI
jgi:Rrf2 family protein